MKTKERKNEHEAYGFLCLLCRGCAGPAGGGFLQLPQQADVGLALLFAMAFGAGNTNRVLAKWAQDSEYQKHVMDERNLAIKEKAGNITNMFTTTLLGIAIVVFLCMGYVFPAVVLGGVVVAQLVSLIFVSSLLEKKM